MNATPFAPDFDNHASAEGVGYSGTDVLEIMAEAENYNAYLLGEVVKHAADPVPDFGAGSGTFATLMKDRGFDVICVEADERQRSLLAQKGFTAFSSLAALSAESVSFVYSLNVLEHIADDEEAARSLFRVLRPMFSLRTGLPISLFLLRSSRRAYS
jgi:SAM-dependent methyltransferase